MNPRKQNLPQDQDAPFSQSAQDKNQRRSGAPDPHPQDRLEAEQKIITPQKQTDPCAARIYRLTTQEREIIRLVAEGKKNEQIADCLGTSEQSLRQGLVTILSKLELTDRLELIIYAYLKNLVICNSKSADEATSDHLAVTKGMASGQRRGVNS